jgi:hypothetical protein
MIMSNKPDNGASQPRRWLRAGHRWLGIASAVFVLLLASTGLALNHSQDWRLDQRFVRWFWLLDAYGIHAPAPSASFADGGHRASLLGQRLYFDGRQVAAEIGQVQGLVLLEGLALVATRSSLVLLTRAGELVERVDLQHELPGGIERIGRRGRQLVVASAGEHYLGDADVNGLERAAHVPGHEIEWSVPSAAPATEIALLQEQFRGQGLSVERLLADIHSGRIVTSAGPLLMDLIAVFLIVLSATGLLMWLRRARRENGGG